MSNALGSPEKLKALLETRCRCHDEVYSPPRLSPVSPTSPTQPHLLARIMRPVVTHVLERTSWRPESLERWQKCDDEERIPVQLANSFVEEAAAWTRDPALGLGALNHLSRGTGDVVELAAECASTLGDALRLFTRFMPILSEAAQYHLYQDDERAVFALQSNVHISHAFRDYQAGALILGMGRWLGALPGAELWFAGHMPTYAPAYRLALGPVQVGFGAPCDAIVLPVSLLSAAPRAANPKLNEVLCRHAERTVLELSDGSFLSRKVRRLLQELLPCGQATADITAQRLRLSSRTLARRLQQEGLDFSTLLGNVRHERALHYLERTDLHPQAIAHLLGYANTSAFSRAFLRWEGVSPAKYRQARREEALQVRPSSKTVTFPSYIRKDLASAPT